MILLNVYVIYCGQLCQIVKLLSVAKLAERYFVYEIDFESDLDTMQTLHHRMIPIQKSCREHLPAKQSRSRSDHKEYKRDFRRNFIGYTAMFQLLQKAREMFFTTKKEQSYGISSRIETTTTTYIAQDLAIAARPYRRTSRITRK